MAHAVARCYCCDNMHVHPCTNEHRPVSVRRPGIGQRAWDVVWNRGPLALLVAVTRKYVADRREFFLYQHHHRQASG
jgi:hypothetical protein